MVLGLLVIILCLRYVLDEGNEFILKYYKNTEHNQKTVSVLTDTPLTYQLQTPKPNIKTPNLTGKST